MKLESLLKIHLITLFLLAVAEVLFASILPSLGLTNFRLALNIIVIIYITYKADSKFLPYLILSVQFVHGLFSIEGWAIGTLIGSVISIAIIMLKGLIDYRNPVIVIITAFVTQLIWCLGSSFFISMKINRPEFFWSYLSSNLVPIVVLSLIAPIIFQILNFLWDSGRKSEVGF